MAKIILRLSLREAMALWSALEWCGCSYKIGKMQKKIWEILGDEIEKRSNK
jgi:hypothetical protein